MRRCDVTLRQKIRTVQGSLVTAEDAVDLLAGFVGSVANGGAVSESVL